MKDKINISELLKDCQKGMELDCSVFEDVTLYKIDTDIENEFPIRIKTKNDYFLDLTKYGTYSNVEEAKCVIFPKGKTTWKGFIPPCKFKDGDVVICNYGDIHLLRTEDSSYCAYRHIRKNKLDSIITTNITVVRLATEEEKQKLFEAIKENGYKWNPETKTLEKLPKFKAGDKIRRKNNTTIIKTIGHIYSDSYALYDGHLLYFNEQDNWELVPNKFDITTLKALQPVLVRNTNGQVWTMDLFSHKIDTNRGLQISFVCVGHCPNQCIPYKGNEHLLGTTNDCDDFYKTWE